MKYSVIKLIGNELIEVIIEFADSCKNGYDTFSFNADVYTRDGSRREPKKIHGKITYYLSGCGGAEKKLIENHFPELLPFYGLTCDRFGMPSYCIGDSLYRLNKGGSDFDYTCKELVISSEVGNQIKQYTSFHFGEFLKKHIEEITKPKIDKLIELLEKLSGTKYVEKTKISAELFNELHYHLVSDKKGWNVFKENPKTTYNEIFDLKHLTDV